MRRPSVGLFLGRPERSAFLARKLRERGFDVTHYNCVGAGPDPVVRVRPSFGAELAHVLLRTRHDVYLTGLSHAPALSLCANRWLRGKPFVFNATGAKWEMFHDQSRARAFPRLFETIVHPFLLARTFGGASRIVTNSRFLQEKIAVRFPAIRDRLLTIYNGIDFARYETAVPAALPRDFERGVVVLCVTSLNFANKAQGLGRVLEAFDRAHADMKELRLVVAAKCSEPRYRESAERHVAGLSSRAAISLRFNEPNVPGLLAAAHLFVFATPNDSNDSLPRALIEAQAAGLPTVTTATSGCPEIVADGHTGRVVAYDSEAIAGAILELARADGGHGQMARYARERAEKVFGWDRMADEYARVFAEVTS